MVLPWPLQQSLPLPKVSSPLIFFHDRKTSGSTLRAALVKAAIKHRLSYLVACHDGVPCTTYDSNLFISAKQSERLFVRMNNSCIIGGHFSYDIQPLLGTRDFTCLTLVNHPLDRMVSYYYERIFPKVKVNLSSWKPDALFATMSTFRLKAGLTNRWHDEGAVNTTIKTICGSVATSQATCDLHIAKERLRTQCIVGLTQRHDDTCLLFNRLLPWLQMNCSVAKHVGKPHEKWNELPAGVIDVLQKLAAPTDQPLYATAVDIFERQLATATSSSFDTSRHRASSKGHVRASVKYVNDSESEHQSMPTTGGGRAGV